MSQTLHANELTIDVSLARELVDASFSGFCDLSLTPLGATGTSNKLFRLGDRMLVRLPRQTGGGAGIALEAEWSDRLRGHLPASIPEIVGLGAPGFGYGEVWSISRWIDGALPPANGVEAGERSDIALAEDLAHFIRVLRNIPVSTEALADSRLRRYRGAPLATHGEVFRKNVELCRRIEGLDLDLDKALSIWGEALSLPEVSEVRQKAWFHGDLVAENLLVQEGRLCGVLDFGGIGVGDPVIDFHGVWEVLSSKARGCFRDVLDVSDADWLRGRAWALAVGLMTFTYYWESLPTRVADRMVMARAALQGD